MRKFLMLIIIIYLIPSLSVRATPPIAPGTFDVIFTSCGDNPEYDHLYFDLLIKPEDYMSDDFFVPDEVIISYQNKFPNYQDFDFLIQGEYISYSAYIYPLFNQTYEPCKYHLETLLEDSAEFYFIVFNDDGTLLYQESFLLEDLGYGEGFKYYTSIVYDLEDNTASLDTERIMTIGETFTLIIFGIIMVIVIIVSIPLIVLLRYRNHT